MAVVVGVRGMTTGRRWRGICWRFRTGSPWRDLPEAFGPHQSVWQRHRLWSVDGTYEAMFAAVREHAGLDAEDLEQVLSIDSTSVRAHQHAAGARHDSATRHAPRARTRTGTQGADLNHTKSVGRVPGEPHDHALGRSRGGLTTKVHALADLSCTPVAALLSAGQAGDNPMLAPLIETLAETGQCPDVHLLADKAYSHPSTRTYLEGKQITHTIPERRDQIARRETKAQPPPAFDAECYKLRNTVERSFNRFKQWRGLATRYDKYAITYLGGVLLGLTILTHRAKK